MDLPEPTSAKFTRAYCQNLTATCQTVSTRIAVLFIRFRQSEGYRSAREIQERNFARSLNTLFFCLHSPLSTIRKRVRRLASRVPTERNTVKHPNFILLGNGVKRMRIRSVEEVD